MDESFGQAAMKPLHEHLIACTVEHMSLALRVCGGCHTLAARLLGLGRATYYRKLAESKGVACKARKKNGEGSQTFF